MKPLDSPELDKFRINSEWVKQEIGAYYNRNNAAFVIPYYGVSMLRVIASRAGRGWDHVSVSLPDRPPTWYELEHVRKLLFFDNEVAVQYHVPSQDHVNIHPNTLHMWRPVHKKLPMPPKELV